MLFYCINSIFSSGVLSIFMSGNFVYKYLVFEAAQALHSSQSRLCCFVGLLLRDVLNGSTTALSVDAGKQVQHFIDSLSTLRRESLISYLFEVFLNLQSIGENNEEVLK